MIFLYAFKHDAEVAYPYDKAAYKPLVIPPPVVVSEYVETPKVAQNEAVAFSGVWDRLAQCESGGRWNVNTGNGYYGGLQFNLSTWQSNGGTGYPHENSREEQIRVAENLRARRGFSPWPACAAKLGL